MTTLFAMTDSQLIWLLALILLSAALAVGAIWAQRVWNDLKGEADDDTSADPDALLAPLAQAFAAGQMTEEEYKRIRQSLSEGAAAESQAPRSHTKPAPPAPGPQIAAGAAEAERGEPDPEAS